MGRAGRKYYARQKTWGSSQCFGSVSIESGFGSSILGWKPIWIQIRIQSGSRILKFTAEKNYIFLYRKLHFTYTKASIKDAQATREAFSPQKRKSSISKNMNFPTFFYFVGHFCPPGLIASGYDPNPDPKHCLFRIFLLRNYYLLRRFTYARVRYIVYRYCRWFSFAQVCDIYGRV
jgi:hypothetical protein